jgi:hypothetical protein
MLATSESSSGGIFSKLWITQQNRAEFLTFRAEFLTFRAEFLTFRAEFLTFRFSYNTENSSYSSFFPSGTPQNTK